MLAVGLRELKNRLAEYVRRVRTGESILITDRGAVIAELGPPRQRHATPYPGLARLVDAGQANLGAGNDAAAYPLLPPVSAEGLSEELIDAERAEP